MIDFSKLECQVASGAAVGIGVEEHKDTFYLPIGYTALTTADEKKQAFFELYRLFKAYVAKNNLDPVKDTRSSQNGTVAKNDGYKLSVKDDESETMLYTKVNFLDTIIDAFDPYAIQNIANRKLYSEEFELEDALNHLDDAVFMPNHAFMVDQAIVDQKQVLVEATELAQMFCFIYCDVKTQLQEVDQVDSQHRFLADKFKELHLFPQASLFEQDSFEQVKTILKDRLELIDHHTPIKDDEYWKLRDAIYAFLYGEPVQGLSDTYWGIKNFWPIWEDLCLESVALSMEAQVVMADTKRSDLFGNTQEIGVKFLFYREEDTDNYPFKISFADKDNYIYPDLIFNLNIFHTNDTPVGGIDNYQICYSEDCKDSGSNIQKSISSFHDLEFTITNKGYCRYSKQDENIRNNSYKLISSSMLLIDFKYKDKDSPRDIVKQRLYLLSTKQFSAAEFWLPSSGEDDNSTPLSLDDFKDNTRNDVRIRKINIKNLVHFYIGGKNA
jgi:hypothetical protein